MYTRYVFRRTVDMYTCTTAQKFGGRNVFYTDDSGGSIFRKAGDKSPAAV